MEFVNQKATEYVEADPVLKIEACGRICYKSEVGSTTDFVLRRMAQGHLSICEHYWIEVFCQSKYFIKVLSKTLTAVEFSQAIKFLDFTEDSVRGNVRAWKELHNRSFYWPVPAKKLINQMISSIVESVTGAEMLFDCLPFGIPFLAAQVADYATFHIVTDRGISHELVRHRIMSFTQESTRYCNYGKIGLTLIDYNLTGLEWGMSAGVAEASYESLIEDDVKPQIARAVLPHNLKTELYMTGLYSQWDKFLDLRLSNAAHPMARELAVSIKEQIYGSCL